MQDYAFFPRLVITALKQQTTYRTALIAGLATNLFFGFLRASLLQGLYGDQEVVNQMSLVDSWTYVGITQALIATLLLFGTSDLMRTVYSGSVAADLLKPVSYMVLWMGRDLGRSLINLAARGILFMLIFQVFYPVNLPDRFDTWLFFILSLSIAWVIHFFWRFLANLVSFWTPDAQGILRLAFTISQFFSGFIMPLRLLPDWFSRISAFTPFPSTIHTPVDIFLEKTTPEQIWQALLMQLAWALVLFITCQLVLKAGVRRLVIQGG